MADADADADGWTVVLALVIRNKIEDRQ